MRELTLGAIATFAWAGIVFVGLTMLTIAAVLLKQFFTSVWWQPLLPVFVYSLLSPALLAFLRRRPPQEKQGSYADQLQNRTIRLVGFSFTSLTFLIGAMNISRSSGIAADALLSLGIGLASFLCAYFLYNYRTRESWFYFGDAATDNGFWCVLLGIYLLFRDVLQDVRLSMVFALVALLFWGHVLIGAALYLRQAHKMRRETHS